MTDAPQPRAEPSEPRPRHSGESTAALVGRWVVMWTAALLLIAVVVWGFTPRGRSREPSNRIKCSSNLRQIGLALKIYANENASAFPPSLREVLVAEEITADVFVCPAANVDTRAAGSTTQAIATALVDPNGHHCSYMYFGQGLRDDTIGEDDVLMTEPPGNHDDDGCNVLFGDGHVDWYATGKPGTPGAAWYARLLADAHAGTRPLRIKP